MEVLSVKNKKAVLFLLILLLLVSVTSYALMSEKKPEELLIINNQIIYRDKVLTDTTDAKQFVCLSPNESKIAFAYKIDLTKEIWGRIGIIDVQTGNIINIDLYENYINAFLNIEWIDNNRVGIVGHRNPSLHAYEIYDINKQIRTDKFMGIGFTWDKQKKHIYYTVLQPHFASGNKGRSKIVKDSGDTLFETNEKYKIVGGPCVSEDNNRIAFFEECLENGNLSLTIANNKNNKFEQEKSIVWNNDIGDISFFDEDNIEINSRFSAIKYNFSSERITSVVTSERIN